jgi:competence protein ComEA
MNKTPSNRFWAVLVLMLIVIIVVVAGIGFFRYQPAGDIEVTLASDKQFQGSIEIGGEVANPGIYPFHSGDSIGGLFASAGGFSTAATTSYRLTVTGDDDEFRPQKININRAEEWLLEALPGIGSTKAEAIVAYREQNGQFRHTSELMNVEGIGQSLYDNIKDLITVTD